MRILPPRSRGLFSYVSLIIAVLLAFAGGGRECLAIDKGICGVWATTIHRPNGDIYVEWKIDPSGNYVVSSRGPNGKMSENGRISTEGNRYMKTTNIGPDNGTFTVVSNRQFSTTGRFGYTEWTRVDGGQPVAAKPAAPLFGGGYNPALNPRSPEWEKLGYGQAGTTKDPSFYNKPQQSGRKVNLQSADLKSLLFSSFPLSGGDEVEQFGLPALGKAATGGMRKRDFRTVQ